jgi:hypothetical protein
MCAKGDDPETVDQNLFRFSVTVQGQEDLIFGYIGLNFEGRVSNLQLTDSSSERCINSLMQSGSFRYVDCKYTSTTHLRYFNITVYAWPYTPVENNLFSHNGAPPLSHFYCDTTRSSAVHSCTVAIESDTFIKGIILQGRLICISNIFVFQNMFTVRIGGSATLPTACAPAMKGLVALHARIQR